MSKANLIVLGELPGEHVPEFERCFNIEFGRNVCTQEIPGAAIDRRICLMPFWPKTEIERMKYFFKGFRYSRLGGGA